MRVVIVLLFVLAAAWAKHLNYEGYKVYRVKPSNQNQVKSLGVLKQNERYDFWSGLHNHLGKPVDIMVEPAVQDSFLWYLNHSRIHYEVLINNVEKIVQEERTRQQNNPRLPSGRISFHQYNSHDEINAYIDEVAKNNPAITSVEVIGKSFEGRDMKVIKISTDESANKPIIFIDGGIHAREWMAPTQATFIISQLLENPANKKLIDLVDWHILPVVNPDGYEYTRNVQRLWRKTRSQGKRCYGADANRNFDFHWGEVGASSSECSDTYMGSKGFSEVEAQAIRDYMLRNKDNIKLYLTMHSYGEYLLFPWGFTSALPDDYDELQALGESVANAIRQVYGTIYTVGTSTNTLYPAAGGSDDWAKGIAGVELSYTIELRGGGANGFDPPPSDILPICTETWEGIKAYHHYIQAKFG